MQREQDKRSLTDWPTIETPTSSRTGLPIGSREANPTKTDNSRKKLEKPLLAFACHLTSFYNILCEPICLTRPSENTIHFAPPKVPSPNPPASFEWNTSNGLVLATMAMNGIYWICAVQLFWEGTWREIYLKWTILASLLAILLTGPYVDDSKSLVVAVLPITVDICIVVCLAVDKYSREQ